MMHPLAVFFLLAAAVSQVAWILSDSKVAEPLRSWVFQHIRPQEYRGWILGWIFIDNRDVWRWLHNGLECAYCTGVWFSFLAASILRPNFLPGGVWTSVPAYALGLALAARAAYVVIERLRDAGQSGEKS